MNLWGRYINNFKMQLCFSFAWNHFNLFASSSPSLQLTKKYLHLGDRIIVLFIQKVMMSKMSVYAINTKLPWQFLIWFDKKNTSILTCCVIDSNLLCSGVQFKIQNALEFWLKKKILYILLSNLICLYVQSKFQMH